MRKALTLSVALALMLFLGVSAFAQPRRMMRPRIMERSGTGILRFLKANQQELKIEESQLAKIEELVFSSAKKMIQMRNEASLQQLELQKLLQQRENLDYDQIKAVLAKVSSIRQELFLERIRLRDQIGKILTPEQKEALKAMGKDLRKERDQFLRRRFFRRGRGLQRFRNWREEQSK
ncbi:MAG: Spy/CpxP family protein refolding chaperone [Candidatus Aminicenantales bacterium]